MGALGRFFNRAKDCAESLGNAANLEVPLGITAAICAPVGGATPDRPGDALPPTRMPPGRLARRPGPAEAATTVCAARFDGGTPSKSGLLAHR